MTIQRKWLQVYNFQLIYFQKYAFNIQVHYILKAALEKKRTWNKKSSKTQNALAIYIIIYVSSQYFL